MLWTCKMPWLGLRPSTLQRGIGALLLLWSAMAFAEDTAWKKREHECRTGFRKAEEASPALLEQCADLFAVHARLHLMGSSDRDDLQKGLRWLYENGADRASLIARDGLYRLGVRLPVRESKPGIPGAQAVVERERYNPAEAPKADQKDAEKLAKDGVDDLLKKRYSRGGDKLQEAVNKDPRSEYAIYNLACSLSLQKKRDDAIKWLQNLADLGTDQSGERLIRARSDGDFTNLRDDLEFKRITGYMRIDVQNSIGDAGEPGMKNILTMLEKLGHKDVHTGTSKTKRDEPQVLFRPHAKAQVALIGDLLNHPRVRLDPMEEEGKYDMVIVWGGKMTKGEDGKSRPESMGPDTVDEKMNDAKRKQNEILAKPEAAVNKVDKIVSTPERTYNAVESMGKRVEGSVKKGEAVFKKVEGIGTKINSL
jgi:urease beta subunit